jgi:site-specific DNA-methyltransferase (adenine-specific)
VLVALNAELDTGIAMNLMLGDCLERMKEIPDGSVDLILADPPYGTTACKWDSIIPLEPMWEQLKRVIKPNGAIVMTASQPFTTTLIASNMKMFKHDIVWFKNVPTGMTQASYAPMKYHESILIFCSGKVGTFNKQLQEREGVGKDCYKYEHYCGESNHVKMGKVKKHYNENLVNPSSIILFNTVPNRKGKLHPTQKPVALMEYLIKTYTDEGETVLDFTMGSGTTGVACKNLGRKFIGIEKDAGYFEIAKQRLGV